MLVVLMSLLGWTLTEGTCSRPTVNLMSGDVELAVGDDFHLKCEFNCSGTVQAQLWRHIGNKEVLLINLNSTFPNVSLEMNIWSASEADAGFYFCKTLPPIAITPTMKITIKDNLKTITSSQPTEISRLQSSTAESSRPLGASPHMGLKGQIWYWMLMGKTVLLLLCLASLAVKYKLG